MLQAVYFISYLSIACSMAWASFGESVFIDISPVPDRVADPANIPEYFKNCLLEKCIVSLLNSCY
jgi:lipase chaperone LimK